MSPRMFAAFVGSVLVLVALVLLLIPVSVDDPLPAVLGGGTTQTACGGPMSPKSGLGGESKALCSDAIGSRQVWTFGLLGAGALVLLGAAVVRQPKPEPLPQPE